MVFNVYQVALCAYSCLRIALGKIKTLFSQCAPRCTRPPTDDRVPCEDKMKTQLAQPDIEQRIFGNKQPFRVTVGFFPCSLLNDSDRLDG